MMKKPIVGILCFDLTVASESVLSLLSKELTDYTFKAFPLFGPPPTIEPSFAYRESHAVGKGVAFSRLDGGAPEIMLRNLGWAVVRDLVRESDIVMLMGLQALPALQAAVLTRIGRKPLITVNQTMSPSFERQRPLSVRLLKRLVLRLSTVCVAQTPPTSATLVEVHHVRPDRVVSALWDGGAGDFSSILRSSGEHKKSVFRRELAIDEETYVVTYVGTLVHLKGVDLLIRAFARVASWASRSLLVLAGPDGTAGGTQAELMSLALSLGVRDSIRFTGACTRETLARLYLASDTLVLPTRKDTWGKVLVEGALAGLPLVTTDVCGAAGHVVRSGVNGYVVKSGNVEDLTEALVKLRNPELRDRMGKESKRIVQEYVRPAEDIEGYRRALQLALSLNERPR